MKRTGAGRAPPLRQIQFSPLATFLFYLLTGKSLTPPPPAETPIASPPSHSRAAKMVKYSGGANCGVALIRFHVIFMKSTCRFGWLFRGSFLLFRRRLYFFFRRRDALLPPPPVRAPSFSGIYLFIYFVYPFSQPRRLSAVRRWSNHLWVLAHAS